MEASLGFSEAAVDACLAALLAFVAASFVAALAELAVVESASACLLFSLVPKAAELAVLEALDAVG
ncbi:hypothetical protein ACYATO_07960 [Lactobacillaceae bacterium Melli_B3]